MKFTALVTLLGCRNGHRGVHPELNEFIDPRIVHVYNSASLLLIDSQRLVPVELWASSTTVGGVRLFFRVHSIRPLNDFGPNWQTESQKNARHFSRVTHARIFSFQ